MKRLSVFIAVIILIPGCSYYDIVKKDKAEYLEGPKEIISKVVFESGEFIQFNKDGGNYYNLNNCIAGMSDDKDFTIIPINRINKVKSNWEELVRGENISADTAFIRKVILKDGKSYTFRKSFGGVRYYKDNKIIIAGFDTSSRYHQTGIDNISYFNIYKLDFAKSFLANLVLVSAGVAIFYYIYKSASTLPSNLTSNF
jgi:hypothetical protein